MICLTHINVEKVQVTPCGSGTLVQAGDNYGILTAAHVVNELERKEKVAIFLDGGSGPLVFKKSTIEFSQCTDAKFVEDGPDIGFIRIPNANVGAIAAIKSFVNLDSQQQKLNAGEPDTNVGVWCTTGFPEALGSQKMEDGVLRTTLFGFVGVGTIENLENRGGFDYCDAGVDLLPDKSMPSTFEGMSGGGLWQVTIAQKDDSLEIADRYLSGVVYYQTAIKDHERFIKCHGRKSIYEYVLPSLVHGGA